MSEAMSVADVQRTWAGYWVGVRDGEVVEARRTADELMLALHDRDIVGAMIFRCPAEDEAELVGLG